MKDALRKTFSSKTNYIVTLICCIGLAIIKYKEGVQMPFLISCLKVIITCFIAAFIGELLGKHINKKSKGE